jgi:hypothetical protein
MPHAALTLRDRCPKCGGLLAVAPRGCSADDDHVQCEYKCPDPDCQHEWIVRWGLGVLDHGLDGAA